MRAYVIALVALALMAGSAGYVTQRWLAAGRDAPPPASAPAPAAPDAAATADGAAAPATALDWSFAAPDGGRHALSTWAGKVVVVNFWATWCPPCLREIPAFMALQERHGADGLQFVGIALDQPEPVADFVASKGITYPVLVGDQDVARFMQALGNDIGALPFTAVLDRSGAVVLTHKGEWEAEEAATALAAILDKR